MADWPVKKNAAFTVTFPIYDNDGDLVSSAAALDSEVDKDAGGFIDATNEATEVGASGIYKLLLTSAEANADIITTITKTTTTNAKTAVNAMYTVTRQLLNLAFPTTSGRSIDVTATGEVGLDLDNTAGALGTAQFDADYLTAALIAADVTTELRALVTGTSDAGGTSTALVDAALTQADDVFNGAWVLFTSGAVANQVRLITDFDSATDTATFAPAATAAIGAGITYEILPNAGVDVRSWIGLVTGLVTPNALISGRPDVNVGAMQNDTITAAAIATAAIDADSIAADAIGASELAADAVNEIADAVLDEDMTAHQTLGTLGQAIGDPVADTTTIYQSVVTDAAGANIAADIVAIEAQTDDIGVAGAGLTDLGGMSTTMKAQVETEVDDALGGGTGTALTAIPWNATWDAEVQSEVDDALVAQRLDELVNADSDIDGLAPPTVGSVFHELLSKTAGSFTFDQTTDSNEAIKDALPAAAPTAAVVADAVWDEDA